jgi:hypothetical protein
MQLPVDNFTHKIFGKPQQAFVQAFLAYGGLHGSGPWFNHSRVCSAQGRKTRLYQSIVYSKPTGNDDVYNVAPLAHHQAISQASDIIRQLHECHLRQ